MADNFFSLVEKKGTQVQKGQRIPIMMNPKRSIVRLIIKMSKPKDKERILKAPKYSYIQGSLH